MEIKGFFFDLCGTLLVYGDMDEAWEDWLETGYDCFRKSGLKLSLEQFQSACDGIFSQPEPPAQNDGLTVYERRLKRLCQEMGHPITTSALQSIAMATMSTWADRMYLDPECPALLEVLYRRCKLVLISNFDHPPYVDLALQKHGLKGYFAEVLVSGAVGLKKPDAAIFRLGLELAGLAAAEVIHTGDSVEDDVKGARAVGIQPVLIQRSQVRQVSPTDYQKSSSSSRVLPVNPPEVEVPTIRCLGELLDMA